MALLHIMVLFGRSYHLSPLGGCQEPFIPSPPHSTEIPGTGASAGWVVEGGALYSTCSWGFITLFSLSTFLGCWLNEVTLQGTFTLVEGFPLCCKGPQGSLMFPQTNIPSLVPSLSEASCCPIAVLRVGSEVFSYPVPPPLRRALSLSTLHCMAVGVSQMVFVSCLDALCWSMNDFFIVWWKGEIPGKLALP